MAGIFEGRDAFSLTGQEVAGIIAVEFFAVSPHSNLASLTLLTMLRQLADLGDTVTSRDWVVLEDLGIDLTISPTSYLPEGFDAGEAYARKLKTFRNQQA